MDVNILYEDSQIIVAEKPPKVPSQSDLTQDEDMVSILKSHLKKTYPKAKDPYIGLVHRLDRPVGGAMVFAKTKEANRSLSMQMQEKTFQKKYLAVVCGKPEENSGILKDYLLKLSTNNMSKVVPQNHKNAKEAILEYECLESIENEEYGNLSLLKINLKTGRHHQIRVQLSHAGLPIWGDNKYNKTFVRKREWTQIALWAHSLTFKHPKDQKPINFISSPEKEIPFSFFL